MEYLHRFRKTRCITEWVIIEGTYEQDFLIISA